MRSPGSRSGEVLTTRSPPADTGAPNAMPGKTVPSSSARSAGPASPTRGSTMESARGSGGWTTVGGAITQDPACRGTGPQTGMRMRNLASSYPASQDRYAGLTGPAIRMGRGYHAGGGPGAADQAPVCGSAAGAGGGGGAMPGWPSAGSSTRNDAPPPGRFATPMRPSWRSTIHFAIARPRPGAAGRRAGRAPEAVEHARHVLGADARTLVLHLDRGDRAGRADRDTDLAAARAVADRVVDEDHHELAEAGRVADRPSRARDPPRPARPRPPRAARARPRPRRRRRRGGAGRASRATAPESERARRSRSSTSVVRWWTSASMSLERVADLADRLVAVPPEVLDRAPDDGQRRAQLVAGVGGELALAAERRALRGERLADRHERAARVDGAEADRDERPRPAPPTSSVTSSARASRPRSCGPGAPGRSTSCRPGVGRALGQEPDRERRAAGLRRRPSGRRDRPPRRGPPSRPPVSGMPSSATPRSRPSPTCRAAVVEREQERVAAAELEAEPGPVVAVGPPCRPGARPTARRVVELGDARPGERAARSRHRARAEHEQHDQRRAPAPRDEAPADAPDEAGLVAERRLLRVVVAGLEPDAVSHRRGGSRRRGPSRSSGRRRRASCAGSGRTRRPRSGSPRRRTARPGRGAGRG